MNAEFYVYRHLRNDTGTPFYVGKGEGRRAWSKKSRNPYWHNIVKNGYDVEIIMENLTEEQAFIKEIEFIEFIKLYKAINYCEANFTNGGEGIN